MRNCCVTVVDTVDFLEVVDKKKEFFFLDSLMDTDP